MVANLETSLNSLDTDYVDVFHLHGLWPRFYDRAMAEIVPALLREKEKGKLRHIAVSETGPRDPEHTMLARAVEEPAWEVFMLAFHMLHQNARSAPAAHAGQQGRHALHVRGAQHLLPAGAPGGDDRRPRRRGQAAAPSWPRRRSRWVSWCTTAAPRASSMPPTASPATSPASTWCCSAPSSIAHLEANIASILRPPLPAVDVQKLYDLFGHLVGVGLDLPDRVKG